MNTAEKIETPEADADVFKGVTLEDLVRSTATLAISLDPKSDKKTDFTMRPIDLSDEKWMRKKWGDGLVAIFETMDMAELSKLAYHQLIEEDREKLKAIEVKQLDDDGVGVTVVVTGWERIWKGIRGPKDKIELYKSLLQLMGLSRPTLSKLTTAEQKEVKKNKNPEVPTEPIGAKSTTDLPVNTGGPSPT